MILLSLEDSLDIALYGGRKWTRDWTHPGEHLLAGRYKGNGKKMGVRTAAIWPGSVLMLGEIYIGITGELLGR